MYFLLTVASHVVNLFAKINIPVANCLLSFLDAANYRIYVLNLFKWQENYDGLKTKKNCSVLWLIQNIKVFSRQMT